MASFKQTMKHGLLHYPTIFPNPVNVCEHLFCIIGNGYEWDDGELVDKFSPDKCDGPLAMKYPDNTERDADLARFEELIPHLAAERRLMGLAEHLRMKFVEDNIETILNGSPTTVYFGHGPRGYYFLKGICIKYAHAFDFPDDIKEDWAKALYTFLEHWLVSLNQEYGPGREKDDSLSWWPKDVLEARNKILETRIRLHPFAHNGQSYELHAARMRELFKDIFKKE